MIFAVLLQRAIIPPTAVGTVRFTVPVMDFHDENAGRIPDPLSAVGLTAQILAFADNLTVLTSDLPNLAPQLITLHGPLQRLLGAIALQAVAKSTSLNFQQPRGVI